MGAVPGADQGVLEGAKEVVLEGAVRDALEGVKGTVLHPADPLALLGAMTTAMRAADQGVNPGVMGALEGAVPPVIPGALETAVDVEDAVVNANLVLAASQIAAQDVETAEDVNPAVDVWEDADSPAKTHVLEDVELSVQAVIPLANPVATDVAEDAVALAEDAKPLVLEVVAPDVLEDAPAHVLVGVDLVALEGATHPAQDAMALVPETVIPPAQTLAHQDALPLVKTGVLETVPAPAVPTARLHVKILAVPHAVLLVILLVKVLASGKHPIQYNLSSLM